jgi:hypothetical protein
MNEQRRTRYVELAVDFGSNRERWIDLDPSGRFRFFEDGVEVFPKIAAQRMTYEGVNRSKILVQTQLDPRNPTLTNYLLHTYKKLIFVDTNSSRARERHVTALVAMVVRPSDGSATVQCRHAGALEFWHPAAEPEKIGWAYAIARIVAQPWFRAGEAAALLTDHDMSRHHLFNAGQVPYLGSRTIPTGLTLAYVSDRAGGVLGHAMKVAHKQAAALLRYEPPLSQPTIDAPGEWVALFTQCRFWRTEKDPRATRPEENDSNRT